MKRTVTTLSLSDKILDLAAECFDAPTLDALAKLRLNPKLAARVDRLAEKANEGELTPRERAEYQGYIKTSEVLGLIGSGMCFGVGFVGLMGKLRVRD